MSSTFAWKSTVHSNGPFHSIYTDRNKLTVPLLTSDFFSLGGYSYINPTSNG